ncbi:ABC transporter permease [Paracoccus onubensis]|uniref:ABC transporter permease n=1 Tax=Paracoccus onubensis TaxID=1675788 RepID=UPI002732220B|nr:ABC transporter permease [Paracoccus onubensis]MDP0926936.1 ABC transporter permease [Paracoccus onubensis]
MKDLLKDTLYPAAMLMLLVGAWLAGVYLLHLPPYLLPSPHDVFDRLTGDFGYLMWHSGVTTFISLAGFFLSIVIGIPLAIALVSSKILDRTLMPWLVLSQTFPKVALAPLITVWFGLGMGPKIGVTFLVAFFPVLISSVVGLRSIESEMIELADSMKASRLQKFWKFRLPMALPSIFAGIKVSVAFSIVGAVIAEWVGATQGLGYLLLQANASLDTSLLFAVLICLTVIGVVLYYSVEWLEKMMIPWHATVRLKDRL